MQPLEYFYLTIDNVRIVFMKSSGFVHAGPFQHSLEFLENQPILVVFELFRSLGRVDWSHRLQLVHVVIVFGC